MDDGSTDSSGAILDEYEAKDNRIVAVHRANEGVSKTRNVDMCTLGSHSVRANALKMDFFPELRPQEPVECIKPAISP